MQFKKKKAIDFCNKPIRVDNFSEDLQVLAEFHV